MAVSIVPMGDICPTVLFRPPDRLTRNVRVRTTG
jgi:hypothetical protein